MCCQDKNEIAFSPMNIRGVHGCMNAGGESKNNWKNIFKGALVKQFSKKFQNEAT